MRTHLIIISMDTYNGSAEKITEVTNEKYKEYYPILQKAGSKDIVLSEDEGIKLDRLMPRAFGAHTITAIRVYDFKSKERIF